jgi:hypothetical protein
MTKFERITAALDGLSEARKAEIADIMEALFHGDLHPSETALNDEQLADLERRLKNPGPVATEAEVDAFFARLTA